MGRLTNKKKPCKSLIIAKYEGSFYIRPAGLASLRFAATPPSVTAVPSGSVVEQEPHPEWYVYKIKNPLNEGLLFYIRPAGFEPATDGFTFAKLSLFRGLSLHHIPKNVGGSRLVSTPSPNKTGTWLGIAASST